jgi:hypothetical protein
LLFEYIPHLKLLDPTDVNSDIVAKTRDALNSVHAFNVCHDDLWSRRALPAIRFNNIFIQEYSRELYILDFNGAKLVENTLDGQASLREEMDELDNLMKFSISGENLYCLVPREVLRLME